jgi:hypothetical protein
MAAMSLNDTSAVKRSRVASSRCITITGQYTQQNNGTGGSGFADFLQGDVEHWQATNQSVTYMRIKDPQLFVQDDFKVLWTWERQ